MMQPEASRGLHAWDLLVSLVATLTALVVPLRLVPDFAGGFPVAPVEGLVTVLFAADVLLRAYRGEYRAGDREGRGLSGERRLRAGRLPALGADVLAALPFYLLLGPTPLQLLRLLKLARVAGLMRRWRRQHLRASHVLRLAFFVYWLLLSAHWIACGWVALRLPEPTDDGTRYLEALYWCVMTLSTVGYGDVTPQNNPQTLYAIGVMVFGAGVYAYVIGNIATILANIDPVRARYVQHQEELASFMRYHSLPVPLQDRIRTYYDYMWEEHLLYAESHILRDLPASLRTEVSLFLKRDLIERVPLFRGAGDAFLREIACEMEPLVVAPGDVVVAAGAPGRDMYFIARGTLQALAPDGSQVYRTLSDGDFFGEIALFFEQPRTATVRAATHCHLYRLDRAMFDRVLSQYPDVAAPLEARARERYL